MQNSKDEKRDAKKNATIFKRVAGKSDSQHGLSLLAAFNPGYLTRCIVNILKVGGSPTFTSSKDGNAIRVNIYWNGAVQQGQWASTRDELNEEFNAIDAWLKDEGCTDYGDNVRWIDDILDGVFTGND